MMECDDTQQNKVHHHDWLIKNRGPNYTKLMTIDIEPLLPLPPKNH